MIPYFEQPTVKLGPLDYHLFGLFMTAGIISSTLFALYRARKLGIAGDIIQVGFWFTTTGLLLCIVVPNLIFRYDQISEKGIVYLLAPNSGINSASIFIVCGLTIWTYFKIHEIPFGRHCDVLLQGLVVGWIFGRLGCTFAHDHIGLPSNFILAFDYPSGARHNLGFYEFIFTALVLAPIALTWRNDRYRPFTYSALLGLLYGFFRFLADFLRAYDPRYLGLTTAQWLSVVLVITGLLFFRNFTKTTP